MTWVRVETSGGARYRAPSSIPLPELEGFDKLFQGPLYMRQLHVFPYFPPTQQPGSANGTNPVYKNTIANDADEVCSEMLVLLDQVELGGRLGLVSIAAGGLDTTEAALQVLLHYTVRIIRSTTNAGVQCLLDAITTLPPPDTSARGDGEESGEMAAAANLPTRLREVRENDGLVHFDGMSPPQHLAEVFNQETAKCKGNGTAAGQISSSSETASALHHFDNKNFKNRNFLYTLRGTSTPTAGADDHLSTPPATVSSPAGHSTEAVAEKPSTVTAGTGRTEALYRRSFQYYIETNTVPLSLCFSTVVATTQKVAAGTTGTDKPATTESATTRRSTTAAGESTMSVDDADSAGADPDTKPGKGNGKLKKIVLSCQSNVLRKPGSTAPTDREADKTQVDYWKAFARRCSKLNTFLLRAIQHLLKEALLYSSAASRRVSAMSSRRRTQPGMAASPQSYEEGEEEDDDDLTRLKRYIEEGMWTSEDGADDVSGGPRQLSTITVAVFNASGLMFASPAFYGQLSHEDRLLVASSAISQLLAPTSGTDNRSEFYRWQTFPLLCGGGAGGGGAGRAGNSVLDLCFLSMGDSLSLVFGIPQPSHSNSGGASDVDVPEVSISHLTEFFSTVFASSTGGGGAMNGIVNKENDMEGTTGSLSVRSNVSTTRGSMGHFDFYNNKFLKRVQRQLCHIARRSTRPSPPSCDQVLLSLQNMEDVLNHIQVAHGKGAANSGTDVGWAALFEMLEQEETGEGAILREGHDLFDLWQKSTKDDEEYRPYNKALQKFRTKKKKSFCKNPLQFLCCNKDSGKLYLMRHGEAPTKEVADEAAEALANQLKNSATLNLNYNAAEGSALRDGLFSLPLDFMFSMMAKDVCLLERDAFQPLRKLSHVHSCYWLLRSLPGEHKSARRHKDGDQLKHNQIGQYCVGYFRPVLQQEHRRNGARSNSRGTGGDSRDGRVLDVSSPILNTFYPTSVAGATSFELVEDPSVLLPLVVQPEGLSKAPHAQQQQQQYQPSEDSGYAAPFVTTFQVLTLPRQVLFSLASLPPALQDQRLYRQFGALATTSSRGTSTAAAVPREAVEEEAEAAAAADRPREDRTMLKCLYLLYPHRLSCSKRMMGLLTATAGGVTMDSETFMDVEGVVTLSVKPIQHNPSATTPAYAVPGGGSGGEPMCPSSTSYYTSMDGYLEHCVLDALQRQESTPSLSQSDRTYFSAENATGGRSSAVEAAGVKKKLETRIDVFGSGDGGAGNLCAELVQCQKVVHSLFENVC